MILRDYQESAVQAMVSNLEEKGNSVIVLPTAGGKSWIIAEYVKRTQKKTLIFCPSKEILDQNKEKLSQLVDPELIGTYSASAGEKKIRPYTFATIGSVYRKPQAFCYFETIIVDECQNVRPDKLNSMYIKLFRYLVFPKTFGLTASPFINVMYKAPCGFENNQRMMEVTTKLQLITRLYNPFWKSIIYDVDPEDLEKRGYTTPVDYRSYTLANDMVMRLNASKSEFDQNAFARLVKSKETIIADIVGRSAEKFNSVLVFCANVGQAESLKDMMKVPSAVVTAKTNKKVRSAIIDGFKSGQLKVVFNVACLTVGFDHPALDCIVAVRPTKSLGLWQQMVGRGVRISPETGKTKCTVIDLGGNYRRLGDATKIKLVNTQDGYDIRTDDKYWHNHIVGSYKVKI